MLTILHCNTTLHNAAMASEYPAQLPRSIRIPSCKTWQTLVGMCRQVTAACDTKLSTGSTVCRARAYPTCMHGVTKQCPLHRTVLLDIGVCGVHQHDAMVSKLGLSSSTPNVHPIHLAPASIYIHRIQCNTSSLITCALTCQDQIYLVAVGCVCNDDVLGMMACKSLDSRIPELLHVSNNDGETEYIKNC